MRRASHGHAHQPRDAARAEDNDGGDQEVADHQTDNSAQALAGVAIRAVEVEVGNAAGGVDDEARWGARECRLLPQLQLLPRALPTPALVAEGRLDLAEVDRRGDGEAVLPLLLLRLLLLLPCILLLPRPGRSAAAAPGVANFQDSRCDQAPGADLRHLDCLRRPAPGGLLDGAGGGERRRLGHCDRPGVGTSERRARPRESDAQEQ